MDALPIPASVADLTPLWLTQALRQAGRIERAAVISVRCQVLGEGRGFTGQVARPRLTYDVPDPGAPSTLIAKLPAAAASVQGALQDLGLYAREVRFYQELAAHPDLPVPGVFHAAVDADGAASILLLEEIAGGRGGDDLRGCSEADAVLAISQLARVHAVWWEQPALAARSVFAPVDPEHAQSVCQQRWAVFQDRLGERMPARLIELGCTVVDHVAAYRRWLSAPPQTLMHGDFRLDNLVFGPPGSARPLTIVDWQTTGWGRGVADVTYFAAMCLPIALRRSMERRLVTSYHAALAAAGVDGYAAGHCWRDYRTATLGVLIRLIVSGGIVDFSSERGSRLARVLLERTDALLADHDAGALLATGIGVGDER